ncbi:MAG TPA: tetratricopeptide repeat protein [Candidatus Angelobacter sp.]|jgi:tetratricopeptide (TPR) repeat protein|nr:tetratricopeptide repeat protein [Candidatus Angelobacter sp.]
MKRKLLRLFCFLWLLAFYVPELLCAGDALEAARREYALHFFDAEAHVRLAKELNDHGQRLAAFFVLEAARREHFEQAEFTRAFRRVFLNDNFDNSPEAEAHLRAQLQNSPYDFEKLTKLADIYISRDDWTKAVPLLQRASKLQPDDFSTVAALAQVYQGMDQDEKAQTIVSRWTKQHPYSLHTYQTEIHALISAENAVGTRLVIERALKRFPNDALLHFDLGQVFERRADLKDAQREFERAVQLAPRSVDIQGWVARFFLKAKPNPRRSLDLYLNAYFLDPDFYETEYAESRIPELARQVLEEQEKNSVAGADIPADLMSLVPMVEETLLNAAKTDWSADSMDKVLKIMGSDDEENRWNAMRLAAGHLNEISDERLAQLLEDPDVRKRGMAGYLAVLRGHDKAVLLMKKWLEDPVELIRYDAISALMLYGDAADGKIVEEYIASGKEPNARLREDVSKGLAQESRTPRE